MSDFLSTMEQASRARLREAQSRVSAARLGEQLASLPPPPRLPGRRAGFELIAEVKRRSPAAGALGPAREDLGARVATYARAGAAAVSVLTEPTRFDGALEHVRLAADALQEVPVPVMRKDFLVDPYQVLEARVAGAGGVLVILRMLSAAQALELVDAALELGLFVLLEAFDEHDIERAHALTEARLDATAAAAPARLLVGVNCRDLATLQVIPGRLEQLAAALPGNVPRVAESGVATAADAARVAAAGYDWALVGSALMSAADPARTLAELLAAGRRVRAPGTIEAEGRP
jgi:indole-3-glycerol phosphate synthase